MSCKVPVDGVPPTTVEGENATCTGWGARICRPVAEVVPYAVADSNAVRSVETGVVETVNEAVRVPAATVTEAEVAAAGSLEASDTTVPPAGASASKETCPRIPMPPTTRTAESDTDETAGFRTWVDSDSVLPAWSTDQ